MLTTPSEEMQAEMITALKALIQEFVISRETGFRVGIELPKSWQEQDSGYGWGWACQPIEFNRSGNEMGLYVYHLSNPKQTIINRSWSW